MPITSHEQHSPNGPSRNAFSSRGDDLGPRVAGLGLPGSLGAEHATPTQRLLRLDLHRWRASGDDGAAIMNVDLQSEVTALKRMLEVRNARIEVLEKALRMTERSINLSDEETALCIGCLELGVKELREGQAAAGRLGMPLPNAEEVAAEMNALAVKLRGVLGEITSKKEE